MTRRRSFRWARGSLPPSTRFLSLLIASAKGSFETQSGYVRQMIVGAIRLDRILARYGAEARGVREEFRQSLERVAAQIWSEKVVPYPIMPFQATIGEQTIFKIQELAPQNDMQRSLKTWAMEISGQLVNSRLLFSIGLPPVGSADVRP